MIQAVVFDMDGLMFDTERPFLAAWDYAGEQTGIGKAGYMNYKVLGMNVQESRAVWEQEFGSRFDEEAFMRYSREYLNQYYTQHGTPLKPGLFPLLEYLKEEKVPLAVATSTRRESAYSHLERAGVIAYFQAIVCGDMVEHAKPWPDLYLEACKKLGKQPRDCLALEDSPNGVLSAYRAGLRPIVVPDLLEPDEETKRRCFAKRKDLFQVLELIKELRL